MPRPPQLEYAPADPARRQRRVIFQIALAFFVSAVLGISYSLVSFNTVNVQALAKANQIKCAANFRQIGQAIAMYRNHNRELYPPTLPSLVVAGNLNPFDFLCPRASDTKAAGPTTAAVVKDLSTPGHCSYIYVGANLTSASAHDSVVAFENPANHNLEGGCVLLADGSVNILDLPDLMQAINDLAAGKNPPSATTSLTTASARQNFQTLWRSRLPQLQTGVWHIPTTMPATQPVP